MNSIYPDFCRSIDVVNFDLVVRKMAAYGFHGFVLSWLKSFPINRIKKFQLKGFVKGAINVTSGVAQGSQLGPLLFLLFNNDISHVIEFSEFFLFADDAKV